MFTRTTRAKRNIATVALAALVGSLLALSSPAVAGPTTSAGTQARYDGVNRYDTAAKIALSADWATTADQPLTIVNGTGFADGLAAAGLGNRVLLVTADSIPTETADALAAIKARASGDGTGQITIVGGSGVVSSDVLEALGAYTDDGVRRLSGADRYATALEVAKAAYATPGHVILATGTDFPDALAAGPLAIQESAPILLVQGTALDADVKAYLAKATDTIYIVGGEGVVSSEIEAEVAAMGKTTKRLSGADREATAVAIAGENSSGTDAVVLVNRNSFADALAAGPLAGQLNGSVMPVATDSVAADVVAWHETNCDDLEDVVAAGGTAVISATTLGAAANATACTAISATATVATTAKTQVVFEVNTATVTTGASVRLTAVPGSVTDGAAGNDWAITITDAATASVVVDETAKTMTVGIPIVNDPSPATTMSQASFVSAWNALGSGATNYFTASVAPVGNPVGYTDGVNPTGPAPRLGAAATSDQVITLTFNQAVDNDASTSAGVVLAAGSTLWLDQLGTNTTAVAPASQTPFTSTPGGASVYTFTITGLDDVDDFFTAGTSKIVLDDTSVAGGANIDVFSTATGVQMTTNEIVLS